MAHNGTETEPDSTDPNPHTATGARTRRRFIRGATGLVGVGLAGCTSGQSTDPDDDHSGELAVTARMDAKIMKYTDDPDRPKLGARGGGGFIPFEMLTSERDSSEFRCYNWVDDPIHD